MRIMRFTILSLLTLLMLAMAIPAAATTCSICVRTVTVSEDGTTQTTSAQCEPSTGGDIPDCRPISMRGEADCASVSLVAACGEGGGGSADGCPPWGCIYLIKDKGTRKMRSVIRPVLSAM